MGPWPSCGRERCLFTGRTCVPDTREVHPHKGAQAQATSLLECRCNFPALRALQVLVSSLTEGVTAVEAVPYNRAPGADSPHEPTAKAAEPPSNRSRTSSSVTESARVQVRTTYLSLSSSVLEDQQHAWKRQPGKGTTRVNSGVTPGKSETLNQRPTGTRRGGPPHHRPLLLGTSAAGKEAASKQAGLVDAKAPALTQQLNEVAGGATTAAMRLLPLTDRDQAEALGSSRTAPATTLVLLAALLAAPPVLSSGARVERLFYQSGNSESELPECGPRAVCNRVDTYGTPWVERQCRCPGGQSCPRSLDAHDGHTVRDKWRLLKLCEPVDDLPRCRYFRDAAWTVQASPSNGTMQQTVHCRCPRGSVAYIFKHRQPQLKGSNPLATPAVLRYAFACSPLSRLRCQRKEPCRLFTVRKRPDVEEVNASTLCQCPRGWHCPAKHTEAVPGPRYDRVRTYSAYCTAPDH
ncbi:hypothetical protein HPB50_015708 [Hyalomma asiaticum]|uniref:Uncharacterized protein n=1 Tax=Hyalomma asiaticum TaxID=266040 RepID=A0ACB7SYV2_HYAAI|nr:hypothetical protein HPB50_015708 [Hyalomma asiaticum]